MGEILWFKDCNYDNTHLIGGKNASLGKLIKLNERQNLFCAANGFAITTIFYDDFIKFNNLNASILKLLSDLNHSTFSIKTLNEISRHIKKLFSQSTFSCHQHELLEDYYQQINKLYKDEIQLAIRSSAIAEDLPHASFAGQQDTYLNISNLEDFKNAIIDCYASLFNANAISYRVTNKIQFEQVKMSVAVQKMVRSDLAIAGVAFSLDPQSGYKKCITVNSAFGLGEGVVSGIVNPDEIIVDKRLVNNEESSDPIIDIKIGQKKSMIVYNQNKNSREKTKEVQINNSYMQNKLSINENQIKELSSAMIFLENHFREEMKKDIAIDVEWAYDGPLNGDNKLYILQVRAETIHSNKDEDDNFLALTQYSLDREPHSILEPLNILTTGVAIGSKISHGKLIYAENIREAESIFEKGDILVTDMTTPDWEPIMKKSNGIITNKGGKTCHAAIVARELDVNAIVGCVDATLLLDRYKNRFVTIDCSQGALGKVYEGKIPYKEDIIKVNKEEILKKNLNVMMNIGNPEIAFKSSLLPHKGVGLTRLEFIINDHIKIHPKLLLDYSTLPKLIKNDIDKITNGIDTREYFVKNLARGVSKIASAFYPEKVIVRFSDFKSNEYKNLIGGDRYEPDEENPMLGWRGACRYYSKEYLESFRMECQGIKYAREVIGLNNITVMIPFCRTPEECRKVIEIMKEEGLEKNKNHLEIYIMCEIPSNIIEADNFAPYINGVSIGGNDLMQLTLGMDRDSPFVEHIANDKNESYRRFISMAIKTYKKFGIKVGFCGQQPSNSIEFAQFLLTEGIDTISVTPNSILQLLNNL